MRETSLVFFAVSRGTVWYWGPLFSFGEGPGLTDFLEIGEISLISSKGTALF
jgi:hypothetical protein